MIAIVYGYDGSGPGHWQRWLADELAARAVRFSFPDLPDPEWPQKDVWVRELAALVDSAGEPVTFVCHSLGCWAVDHLIATRGSAGIHAVLWVAPPSPYLVFEPVDSFFPTPRDPAAWSGPAARSLLVGSDNDDFAGADELEEIAARLGMRFQLMPGAGHVNVASGFGPLPLALEWLEQVGALSR